MADISDVEEALCAQIFTAVYPQGLENNSSTGAAVKIYRGWPTGTTLNADLLAGTQTVTVFSKPHSSKDTSRYPRVWRTIATTAPTVVITVSGNSATVGGQANASQAIGLIVDGVAYSYVLTADDTLATAAQALGATIPGSVTAGSIITVASANVLQGRVVGSGTAEIETRRQEQGIMVTVWCPTPAGRDRVAASIDNALSNIDWLTLSDGTVGRLLYHGTVETDESENANLYRRNLDYTVEYPTTMQMSGPQMLFGVGTLSGTGAEVGFCCLAPPPTLVIPPLGAIRFDAWYDPSNVIDQQCAAALSPSVFQFRLPSNAMVSNGVASWPLATQSLMDFEIAAAVQAGLSFWAFDSYQPDDSLSLALQLYLGSSIRNKLRFCMLGQSSNWGDGGTDQPSLFRDISMMTQPGYMTVLDDRPLYFVLDASPAQLAGLPPGGIATAIAFVRSSVQAAGGQNPYVVWLSGASLADYSNIAAAQAVGADAAGAYAVSSLNGAEQPYSSLTATAAADWRARANSGFPMVPTAMTGWDQRPLIASPQPFYPIAPGLTPQNHYDTAGETELASHIVALVEMVNGNRVACPAQVGLVYAWNELAEGGWLMPTYTSSGPDMSRAAAMGTALAAAVNASVVPTIALIT